MCPKMDVTGVWAWMLLDTDALGDVVGTGLLGEMDARRAPHRYPGLGMRVVDKQIRRPAV